LAAARRIPTETLPNALAQSPKAPAKDPTRARGKAPSSAQTKAADDVPAGKAPSKPVGRAARPAALSLSTGATTPGAAAPAGSVVVVPDRTKYHLDGCRFVRGLSGAQVLTRAAAAGRGYAPCGVCKP